MFGSDVSAYQYILVSSRHSVRVCGSKLTLLAQVENKHLGHNNLEIIVCYFWDRNSLRELYHCEVQELRDQYIG
jgi:hypothetical protein